MHEGQSECGRTCKGGGEGADFCRHGKPVDEGSLVGHQDLWLHSRHAASTEHVDRQDNDHKECRETAALVSASAAHWFRSTSARAWALGTHAHSLARSSLARSSHAHTPARTHTRAHAGTRGRPDGRALSTVLSRLFGLAAHNTRSRRQRPLRLTRTCPRVNETHEAAPPGALVPYAPSTRPIFFCVRTLLLLQITCCSCSVDAPPKDLEGEQGVLLAALR
jgi:hypothetical protein